MKERRRRRRKEDEAGVFFFSLIYFSFSFPFHWPFSSSFFFTLFHPCGEWKGETEEGIIKAILPKWRTRWKLGTTRYGSDAGGVTEFYRVLPGFTGFYRVLPGFDGSTWVGSGGQNVEFEE